MTNRPPLNKKLTPYGGDQAEQDAYQKMEVAAFEVAELLMAKPRGTTTTDIGGHVIWLSPRNGLTDIFLSPEYAPMVKTSHRLAISEFEGQGASELDEYRSFMQQWLQNPQFAKVDADLLDSVVAG